MNFSGVSNKSTIGKLLRLPLRLIPRDAALPVVQGRLRGKKWIVGSSNHGCWLGSYEYSKQALFARIIREGNVVFDIGANVGFYTLLASVLVGKLGKVFAFEPLLRNLQFLKRHLELNHISNVKVCEIGVSDRSGTAHFEEGPDPCMGKLASTGGLVVRTASLDDLHASGEFGIPDVMKIDVEGAELGVLRGAHRILTARHPKIFLATHGPEIHRECCDFLQGRGYKLQAIGAESVGDSDEVLAS